LVVPALLATTVLCKSFGATALVLVAILTLWGMRALGTSLPMALLVCLPSSYVLLRTGAAWSGAELAGLVGEVNPERASSLSFRLTSEEKLRVKAAEKPLLGWGGWGRSLVSRFDDPRRAELVITDSLWIIVLGKNGIVGLVSLLACFFVPVLALWRLSPPRRWARPGAELPWALALVLTLYALDNLVNAMINPVFCLIAGGLCGLALVPVRVARGMRVARARERPTAAVPVA